MTGTFAWTAAALTLALVSGVRGSAAQAATARVLDVLVIEHDLTVADFDAREWAEAPETHDLAETEPNEGQRPTLLTECRVIATPTALLFHFVMEEAATEFVAKELRRDANLLNDDRIGFVLDTYRDRRNAYYFATNPNGVRTDGLVVEQGTPSYQWDGIWDVRVRRTVSGWDALFRIPFATLSFPSGRDATWGFNFSRSIPHRHEIDRWSGWQRAYLIFNVSQAGALRGLPPLRGRTLRSVTPYATTTLDQRAHPAEAVVLSKAGVDLRYPISTSVEADLTVNTDFAETEVDSLQFNFGRASLYFPEKRAFFLQRADLFSFGSIHLTFPFYSRTIGLSPAGEVLPIDAGLKLIGRLGATDFGGLAVQTRATSAGPRSDYVVARMKRDVGRASYVGVLLTDLERSPADSRGAWARAVGVDHSFNITPQWNFSEFYVATETDGSRTGSAWNTELLHQGKYTLVDLDHAHVGSAYDPQMGFVQYAGIDKTYIELAMMPRPHVFGLRQTTLDAVYLLKLNEDGSLNERDRPYSVQFQWPDNAVATAVVADVLDEHLTAPLQLTKATTIPVGRYHFVRQQISFASGPSRTWAVSAGADVGRYYGGTRRSYTGGVVWKPSSHVGVSISKTFNVVRLPQGNFDLSLLSARFNWSPSVRALSSVLVQSDNLNRLTEVQAVFRWLIDPAVDVFAVADRQIGDGFDRPGTRMTVKVRKTFSP